MPEGGKSFLEHPHQKALPSLNRLSIADWYALVRVLW
jgi:hypothetical protein